MTRVRIPPTLREETGGEREVAADGDTVRELLDSKVLLLGAGGLGSPAALYLAAAGVGKLGIVDDDVVDTSNLQRQVLHSTARLGEAKALSAKAAIEALNPDVEVVPYRERLTSENIDRILADGWDVIVDGADNFPTRYLVNDASLLKLIPVVHGSIFRFEGQATEVIKLVTGAGEPLVGRLLLYEALGATFTELKVRRDPDCPICSREPSEIADEEMGVFPDYEAFCAAAG